MPEHIKYHCEYCGQKLKSRIVYAGKTMPCPKCGKTTHVPPITGQVSPIQAKTEQVNKVQPKDSQTDNINKKLNKYIIAGSTVAILLFFIIIFSSISSSRERTTALEGVKRIMRKAESFKERGEGGSNEDLINAYNTYKLAKSKLTRHLKDFNDSEFELLMVEIDTALKNEDLINAKKGRIQYKGEWLTSRQFDKMMEEEKEKAIQDEADRIADEKKKQGFVLHEGQWMTPLEKKRMQGFREFLGQWLKSDKAIKVLNDKSVSLTDDIDNTKDFRKLENLIENEILDHCREFIKVYPNSIEAAQAKEMDRKYRALIASKKVELEKTQNQGNTQANNNRKQMTAPQVYSQNIESVVVITHNRGGAGSGFIVDANGYICTNKHVVEGAQRYVVYLHTLQEDNSVKPTPVEAELVRVSAKYDIAILKIDSTGRKLKPCKLGHNTVTMNAEDVLAIGSPGAGRGVLMGTATRGVVSNVNRVMNGIEYLQIDASINSGNSGGPLFNMFGEVIGINTWKFVQSGGINVEGLGFALKVKYLVEELRNIRR